MEEGSCAVSRWILIKLSMLGICFWYRPHCLLPWQQTEISLHTLHPSAFQHWNHSPLSSLPTPSKLLLLCTQHHPEFGEYTSIDLLQKSKARPITWLIQMSVRSPVCFFSLFKRYQFESELHWPWLNRTMCNRMNWAAIHKHVVAARCLVVTQLCEHFGLSCIMVWGNCVGKFSVWPSVEGWARWKRTHSVTCLVSSTTWAEKKHIFGLQTEIDSPPPYLGDSGDDWTDTLTRRGSPENKMPDQTWACFGHFDPWPISILTPWSVRDGQRSVRGSILSGLQLWASEIWHFITDGIFGL